MKKNLSRFEASLRLFTGSLLFLFFMLGGPTWMVVGLYLMLTGSFRFCAFYYYLARKNIR